MPHDNPFSSAAEAYGATAAATDQRALEGKVLLKAARQLEDLSTRLQQGEKVPLEDIDDVLTYNRKLWQVFIDSMMDPSHPMPQEVKNNVASLALFVFKRTQEILLETTPEKFGILISINRNIASGLMKAGAIPHRPGAAAAQEKIEGFTSEA